MWWNEYLKRDQAEWLRTGSVYPVEHLGLGFVDLVSPFSNVGARWSFQQAFALSTVRLQSALCQPLGTSFLSYLVGLFYTLSKGSWCFGGSFSTLLSCSQILLYCAYALYSTKALCMLHPWWVFLNLSPSVFSSLLQCT